MIFVGHNLVETAKTPEGRSQEVRVEVIYKLFEPRLSVFWGGKAILRKGTGPPGQPKTTPHAEITKK